ncbi:MAG: DedA family protein [Syntrophomonadales bacterium]
MELLLTAADFLLNLDQYVIEMITRYDRWATLILFLVIFCETGLVVTPFLPGDSLLFVLGALGATGQINLVLLAVVLTIAAVTGNMLNYQIGRFVGPKIFDKEGTRLFNRDNLIKTKKFYERHGGKTIVIGRFLPVLRTFVPFVAGVGMMKYGRFFFYNLIGGILWVVVFFVGGYFFGNMPIVQENFSFIIMGVIAVTLAPAFVALVYNRRPNKSQASPKENP